MRRAVVLGAALVYWVGVLVQVRRIRRQIGRSPNVRPRGLKEKLLWAGWFIVIVAWMGQPLLIASDIALPGLRIIRSLLHSVGLTLGIVMTLAGYAGTLWCYAAIGDNWRMGIDRHEKNALVTRGPYRFVRHPIYLFQMVMLAGVIFLLPTPLSLIIFVIHVVCVLTKALDEESYLLTVHGNQYRDYLSNTGRLFPRFFRRGPRAE